MNLKAALPLLVGSSLGISGVAGTAASHAVAQAVPTAVSPPTTPSPPHAPPGPECSLAAAPEPLPAAPQGLETLSGTARWLSLEWGEIYVAGVGAPVRVWAAPWEIAQLIPGQKIRVRTDDYGRVVWLDPTGAQPDVATFARFGELRGTVRKVERTLGVVTVRLSEGVRVFRARPEDLAQVLPGQAVSFDWVRVGRVDWWIAPPGCANG